MKILYREDKRWYVFGDDCRPRITNAVGGPFETRQQAAWWIVDYHEQRLTEREVDQWGEMMALAGGLQADPYQLITILGMIRKRAKPSYILASAMRVSWNSPSW